MGATDCRNHLGTGWTFRGTLACVVIAAAFSWSKTATAQAVGFGAVGGVYIDPDGMLRETKTLSDQDLRARLAEQSAGSEQSQQAAAPSDLRKISLRRLEQSVARLHEANEPLPAEMRFLAGLTAIRYVLIFPEEGDVVLAGPADAWLQLPSGDVVGQRSNRPALQLDDLIVALRYAFGNRDADGFMGCSIEPTEKGVQAHNAYVRNLGAMNASRVPEVEQGLEQAVGPQDVHIYGVEPSTRFALQMIAADYRLKRIALAHDPSPAAKLPSYLDLAERSITGGQQRQHRWWFVGHYDAIRQTADRLAFELEGQGLKVDTAPSQPGAPQKKEASRPAKSAKMFADLATKHLPEMARNVPVIAELQNLVGLATASALIRRQADQTDQTGTDGVDAAGRAPASRWRPAHFLDDEHCPIARFVAPRQTPSLANTRFVKNQFWMFSVSGGVEINPVRLADDDHRKPASGTKLGDARRQAAPPPDETRWWWD